MATSSAETTIHRVLMLEPLDVNRKAFENWRYEVVCLPCDDADAFSLLDAQPDAILADFSSVTTVLFESVRTHAPYPKGPLLVFVTSHETTSSVADICVTPQNIELVLAPLLHVREEAHRLHESNQALLTSNHELKLELHRERLLRNASEVLKNMIVRNVSHELRTPLLQIKTAVALMAETLPLLSHDEEDKTNQTATLVELATGATTRLETHVRNITMLGESIDPKIGPMILRDAAEAARRNLFRLWEFRDQVDRIEFQVPSNLPPVLGDKTGISTVLQLLLDNALKFSTREVILSAHVSESSNTVLVRVRDFGIGIAPDELDKIFDTFYQVDGSDTRSYGGAGVGLALVRIILARHNIQIRVESEKDIGSSFCFRMPIMLERV